MAGPLQIRESGQESREQSREQSREEWNSEAGFLFAAIGSAVGLGNMWRFSYLTAEKGGAAFVALYLGFTLLIGLPLMLAELTIGRGSRRSPVEALVHYARSERGKRGWSLLGLLFVAAGFLILSYYGVIAGWTLRYAGEALLTGFAPDAGAHFGAVSEGLDAFAFHLLFMGATVWIVHAGIKTGIERVSTLAIPALLFLVIGIAIYAATLPGAGGGYAYYLNADLGNVWQQEVVVAAAGQAFFSLSLGMGAMLTYASYLGRDSNLPRESGIIATADFGIAFLAGLMVFPIIFAFGLQDQVGESTVGALFVALPNAFASMGAAGRVVGCLFFVALVVGALTSAISLLEVVVSAAMDSLGWERARATWAMGAAITLLGGVAAFSSEVLGVMDQVANNLFLVGGGLGLACFVGFVMEDPIAEAKPGTRVGWLPLWLGLIRFVVPVVLVWVLWNSVPATLDAVRALF
jgi:NSS family neurotransmitter:Na+ symporter